MSASAGPRTNALLFFALLVASVAVALIVVRARTPDLVLEVTAGLPTEVGRGGESRFRFFVRESDPEARIAIVDSSEDVVRTLDASRALAAGEEVEYVWDARDDAGTPVESARYRLLVELPASERVMIWPRRITVGSPPAPNHAR